MHKRTGAQRGPGPFLSYPSPKEWHLINQSQIRLDSLGKMTERTSSDSMYRSFHLPRASPNLAGAKFPLFFFLTSSCTTRVQGSSLTSLEAAGRTFVH